MELFFAAARTILKSHHFAVCAKTVFGVLESGTVIVNRFDDDLSVAMKHLIGVSQRRTVLSHGAEDNVFATFK